MRPGWAPVRRRSMGTCTAVVASGVPVARGCGTGRVLEAPACAAPNRFDGLAGLRRSGSVPIRQRFPPSGWPLE